MKMKEFAVGALSILAVFFLVAAAATTQTRKAMDEDGEEVPSFLVRCIDLVEFEPEDCNKMGLAAAAVEGCEYVGDIRLCGQFIPRDPQAH